MGKKIIFCGFKNYLQIKSKLKKIDIFINCSYFEGFPNSVVESLANGTPVLASQSFGGINEIIKNIYHSIINVGVFSSVSTSRCS